MCNQKVFIYPSLGASHSMARYLTGVVSGFEQNDINYEIIRPRSNGLFAKYFLYPLQAFKNRRGGRHLVISERYGYLIPFLQGSEVIIVCHDLHTLYKEANTAARHRWVYKMFLKCMLMASKVICVSSHTKNDLLSYMPSFRDDERVKVVPNGIEPFWANDESVKIYDKDLKKLFKKYRVLISVGTDAWYKNNSWTLQFLETLPDEFHLLRIGGFSAENEFLLTKRGLDCKVTFLTKIDDNKLKFCYQNAQGLLFPSLSEGYGWPALEAALSGCPVISNGEGATKEIFLNKSGLIPLENAYDFLKDPKFTQSKPLYSLWNDQVKRLIA